MAARLRVLRESSSNQTIAAGVIGVRRGRRVRAIAGAVHLELWVAASSSGIRWWRRVRVIAGAAAYPELWVAAGFSGLRRWQRVHAFAAAVQSKAEGAAENVAEKQTAARPVITAGGGFASTVEIVAENQTAARPVTVQACRYCEQLPT